jgi:8-oxo-dGTP pyrophosphatase MutT (NUDIX family)
MDPIDGLRTSAPILLFDVQGRVLLIRFTVPRAGAEFTFWAAPGGAVEGDETLDQAARRELQEELGIDVKLFGHVHEVHSEFEHEGHRVRNRDVFFVGRFLGRDITLCGACEAEIGAMRDSRCWSASDLER